VSRPPANGLPEDSAWLPAVRRWAGGPLAVLGRQPLAGGYVAGAVHRVDLAPQRASRVLSVVVKQARDSEVAAMRALDAVPRVDRPKLLAAGPDWLVVPHYQGRPPLEGEPVADEVFELLARVHAHWLGRRPPAVRVVDAQWWAGLCERTLVAVRGALARTGDARFADVAESLHAWRTDSRILQALEVLPRTLVHGDPHRGNLLTGPDGPVLIDWGNARIAPAGLDLAVLAAQGAPAPRAYWRLRAAEPDPVETAWADAHVHVQYMGFAADHLGAARVAEMAAIAARALDALDAALQQARSGRR
jgi:hypothetical protein